VARWFEQTRNVRRRRAEWGEPALDALEKLLSGDTRVWAVLGLDGANLDPFILAPNRSDAVRGALRLHAVSVLITEISRDATRELQSAAARSGRPGSDAASEGER